MGRPQSGSFALAPRRHFAIKSLFIISLRRERLASFVVFRSPLIVAA
jgi:hypothetical protein